MSNRLFAPPAGRTFLQAPLTLKDTVSAASSKEVVDMLDVVPPGASTGLLGDSDWTGTTVSVRVPAASPDFEMEAGRAAEWFEALVPKFKRAMCTSDASTAGAATVKSRSSSIVKDIALPAALLKGAAAVHAFHACGRKDALRFSIVVTDTHPNSLAFIASNGNWMRIGGIDADAGVDVFAAAAVTGDASGAATDMPSTLRETRLILSMFEFGGLVLAQSLCEALCVQGQMPSVLMVGAASAMALADRIQFTVTSMMAAMCDMPSDALPAITVPAQESAVCIDPDSTPIDPETDIKTRRENMLLRNDIRRLAADATVTHTQLAFVWFARINMSGVALIALLDFLSASWVPPPDVAAAATSIPLPPACTVKARGASTEASITGICKWIAAAPVRWRSRFICQLKAYIELVTNKWK